MTCVHNEILGSAPAPARSVAAADVVTQRASGLLNMLPFVADVTFGGCLRPSHRAGRLARYLYDRAERGSQPLCRSALFGEWAKVVELSGPEDHHSHWTEYTSDLTLLLRKGLIERWEPLLSSDPLIVPIPHDPLPVLVGRS